VCSFYVVYVLYNLYSVLCFIFFTVFFVCVRAAFCGVINDNKNYLSVSVPRLALGMLHRNAFGFIYLFIM